MEKEKSVKKITLGGILSWIFGILFLFVGVGVIAQGSALIGILIILCSAMIIPYFNRIVTKKFHFEISGGVKFALVIAIFILIGFGVANTPTQKADTKDTSITPKPTQQQTNVVSTSFDDFSIICDREATNLQKQDLFKKRFEDNYVEWSGDVSSISEGNRVQVKHCPTTFTSDILITMRGDQREKLLKYREGDQITYRAKLTRLGDVLGLSATDGIVIEKKE